MTAGLPKEPDGLPQVNRANEEHSPGRLARRKPMCLSAYEEERLHDFCGFDIPTAGVISQAYRNQYMRAVVAAPARRSGRLCRLAGTVPKPVLGEAL